MIDVFVIGFGAAFALLFALGQLILATHNKRPHENLLLAALLFSMALWQGYSAFFFAGKIAEWHHFAFMNIPAVFATGPLLKDYYLRIVFTPGQERNKLAPWRAYLPYLPFVLSLPLAAVYLTIAPECKQILLGDPTNPCSHIVPSPHALLGIAVFSLVVYLALVIRRVFAVNIFSDDRGAVDSGISRRSLRAYSLLVIAFLLASLASAVLCLLGIFSTDLLIRASAMMVTGILCVGYLAALAGSEWLRWFVVQAQKPKYARSKITQLSHDDVLDRLAAIMQTAHLYRDENLSLAVLSNKVGLSPHQLSELLNEKLGRNFKTYINELRIAEARRLLSTDKSVNILHVGFAVGFNSKSAFNAAFRRITGESPTDYLKKNRPEI